MSAVMHRALREAIRLGHDSAGPVHILLALLDEEHPSVAQEVLRASGLDPVQLEQSARRQYGQDDLPRSGATGGPRWHETAGRAHGFAATMGPGATDAEYVLLALLWQPGDRWLADVLAAAGTTREAVTADLEERGVPQPRLPPPVLPPPKTQAASFPTERVNDVNWALRDRAPDLGWGIGRDPTDDARSVVLAAAHVDLAAVLDDVVGPGAWTWRRRERRAEAP